MKGNPIMKRVFVGLATTVLVSGSLGLAGLSLAAGIAQADGATNVTWCPGQPMPPDFPPSVWDMNVCHTYMVIVHRTPPPPPPPPLTLAQECPGLIPFVNCLPGL
jgi:hypothetical protein